MIASNRARHKPLPVLFISENVPSISSPLKNIRHPVMLRRPAVIRRRRQHESGPVRTRITAIPPLLIGDNPVEPAGAVGLVVVRIVKIARAIFLYRRPDGRPAG